MHCYLGVASMHLLDPTPLFGNSFLYRLNTESFVNDALDLSFVFSILWFAIIVVFTLIWLCLYLVF